MLQARRMGRKQAGENFRMLRNRKNIVKRTKKLKKKKDKLRKRKSREKFMKDFPLLHKQKVEQESKRKKERRQKMQQTITLMRNH